MHVIESLLDWTAVRMRTCWCIWMADPKGSGSGLRSPWPLWKEGAKIKDAYLTLNVRRPAAVRWR